MDEILIQLSESLTELRMLLQNQVVLDEPMTRESAARYLKICPRTMYALVKEGAVKCYYIGPKRNQMRFRKQDLDAYMDACAVRSYEEMTM